MVEDNFARRTTASRYAGQKMDGKADRMLLSNEWWPFSTPLAIRELGEKRNLNDESTIGSIVLLINDAVSDPRLEVFDVGDSWNRNSTLIESNRDVRMFGGQLTSLTP